MSKTKEALEMAIEITLDIKRGAAIAPTQWDVLINACKEALAEQSLTRDWKETILERINKDDEFKEALAEQLSGNSEPLSEDEIHNIADHSFQFACGMFDEIFAFARAIERAHGIGE